jgi:hypothetical protein
MCQFDYNKTDCMSLSSVKVNVADICIMLILDNTFKFEFKIKLLFKKTSVLGHYLYILAYCTSQVSDFPGFFFRAGNLTFLTFVLMCRK